MKALLTCARAIIRRNPRLLQTLWERVGIDIVMTITYVNTFYVYLDKIVASWLVGSDSV